MIDCKCCGIIFGSNQKLAAHIRAKGMDKKAYYDLYLKKDREGICLFCDNTTTFRGMRYLKCCSVKCAGSDPEKRKNSRDRMIGSRQSQETIDKRILNTDQDKKESTRVATMMLKYGSLSVYDTLTDEAKKHFILAVKANHTGSVHTKEHHEKVISTKRKNNNLKHRQETKDKISKSLLAVYQSDDPPCTISKYDNSGGGRNYKHGLCNGIYFRSSYEEKFLLTCLQYNLKVVTAGTKEFRISYIFDNKKKNYYPDFYLVDYDCVVEIKPAMLLADELVLTKIVAVPVDYHNFLVLTEEELFAKHNEWVADLEYLLS
jgi:hypothetical protein